MAVLPSQREEPTGLEDIRQSAQEAESTAAAAVIDLTGTPEADSTAAATVVDLTGAPERESPEPEQEERESEAEPRKAPLLEFWRRRDRGGPAM